MESNSISLLQSNNNVGKDRFRVFLERANTILFLLFVFFAPFSYFDCGLGSLAGYSFPINIFISAAGFFISFLTIVCYHRELLSYRILALACSFLVLCLVSLAVAATEYSEFSGYYGTNPISVSLKISLYFFRFLCSLFYCYFSFSLIKASHIHKVFLWSLYSVAIVSLIQIFVYFRVPFFSTINDFLAETKLIRPVSYIDEVRRLPLTTPEPAHTACIIPAYLFPISFFFVGKNTKKITRILVIFSDCILLVGEVLTFSAEVYITFAVALLISFVFYCARLFRRKEWFQAEMLVLCLFVGIGIVISLPTFRTIVLPKLSLSDTNYSGARRSSVAYVHLMAFLTHPFFGVGSGCAGFYSYSFLINTWFEISSEVRSDLFGDLGVLTSGPSFLWFLSSYGLFGFVIFAIPLFSFVWNGIHNLERKQKLVLSYALLISFFLIVFELNLTSNSTLPLLAFWGFGLSKQRKTCETDVVRFRGKYELQ